MKSLITFFATLLLVTSVSAATKPSGKRGTPAEAKAFVQRVDAELRRLWIRGATADWIKATYITDDTERNAAVANEEIMAYVAEAQKTAARFVGVKVDPETERMLTLLRVAATLPAPSDAKKRAELAEISARSAPAPAARRARRAAFRPGRRWCPRSGRG